MAQRSFCGIDVAKDRSDVMVLPEKLCWSVANDAAGWAEPVARLRALRIAASGIEASGGYERGVVRASRRSAARPEPTLFTSSSDRR